MTTVYFVRHAQPNYDNHDDRTRELTPQGMKDRQKVLDALEGVPVHVVFSSPYKRAIDTVKPLADRRGLPVQTHAAFRERKVGDNWLEDFTSFAQRQWADFDFALDNGESLRQVQSRNVGALKELLEAWPDQTIVVGSHGTALSTVVEHYAPGFGYEGFQRIRTVMPWVVKLTFDGTACTGVEELRL